MDFWTNPKNHTAALVLVHEMYDRATFTEPEDPSQIPLGRVRQASWRSDGAPLEMIEQELAALAPVPLLPHWMMLAFCFLDGPVLHPHRPTSVEDLDAALARALAWKKQKDDGATVDWQIVLPVALPAKTAIPLPRRFCVDGVRMRLVATASLPEPLRTQISSARELMRVVPSSASHEPPGAVMILPARGVSFSDAWDTVSSAFNLLRSTTDFCLSYGGWRLASSQTPRSRWRIRSGSPATTARRRPEASTSRSRAGRGSPPKRSG